ncbi:MAG: NAD(P)/FAD-dependent oxidoreductase [Deltaproteobacteria bacterium]|nr:NAD(P)/FAD-dependent oxidoreductase [Deltaproteobacteria bacterium]
MPVEPHLPTARTKDRSKAAVPSELDVALVGAGSASLTAAAYLAQAGLKVACFDPHYVAGGCATQFARGKRARRYLFDVGLHYIGDCGPGGMFDRILRPVGVDIEYESMDRDGFDVLCFPDRTFETPAGMANYEARLLEHFPGESKGIARYMNLLRQVLGAIAVLETSRGKMTLAVLWHILLHGRLLPFYQGATLGKFLDTCTKNPQLRAVLCGPHGDYALPPSQVSLMLHCGLMLHYLVDGAWYPKGGGQVMANGLADRIEELGGGVHLQHEVTKIDVESGATKGITVADRHGATTKIAAKAVISGADIFQTMDNLLGREHLPASWQKQRDKWEVPNGIFMTCLAIKDDLAAKGFGNRNYWQFDHYDVEAMYRQGVQGGRPNVQAAYITSATQKDPSTEHHAPKGVETVEVMAMLPGRPDVWGLTPDDLTSEDYRHKPEYLERKQRVEDELVRRLDDQFPGVGQHIEFRESSTPITQTRYTRAEGGSGYGLSATPSQFGDKRPSWRGPVPGLYLAGHSSRSGHGIAGALSSGKTAARIVAKDLGISLRKE